MAVATEARSDEPEVVVRSFESRQAETVASWVTTDSELRWLAPATDPPLTAEKVLAWCHPGAEPLLAFVRERPAPIGYAEINAMRRDRTSAWLGHFIIEPSYRQRGYGLRFLGRLIEFAQLERGYRRLVLVVFPDNQPAIRTYRKAGFAGAGREMYRFGRDRREYRMLRMVLNLQRLNH